LWLQSGTQEPAADPWTQVGTVHPVGSCQHSSGSVAQISVHPVGTSRQRSYVGQPYQHFYSMLEPPYFIMY